MRRNTLLACAACGKPFVLGTRRILPGRPTYCSRTCYGQSKRGRPALSVEAYAARAIAWAGSSNPNWKGGAPRARQMHRAWVARNRESVRSRQAARRALKLGAAGSHSVEEWERLKAAYGLTCPACLRAEPAIRLTRDHVIPLTLGGTHYIFNIQPLCKPCNSSKRNRGRWRYPVPPNAPGPWMSLERDA